MYIYQTTINIPGEPVQYYVGSRIRDPQKDTNYFGSGKALKEHIKEFGKKYLKKWVIKHDIETMEQLQKDEVWYIKYFKNAYGDRVINRSFTGNSGYKSEETKRKIGKSVCKYDIAIFDVYAKIPQSELPVTGRGPIKRTTFRRIIEDPKDYRYTMCRDLWDKYKDV